MIRTLILLSCAVSLTGCKDFTSGVDLVQSALRGDPAPAAFVETVAVEQPSSVEVVTVAEPEPPCVPGQATYMWRFYDYDSCTNELIGPTPGYW